MLLAVIANSVINNKAALAGTVLSRQDISSTIAAVSLNPSLLQTVHLTRHVGIANVTINNAIFYNS